MEKIEIPHVQKSGNKIVVVDDVKLPENIKGMISDIIKEIDQGKTVSQIGKKHKISKELAEQICRLYLTHPGVDADGILRKMGL